MKYRVIYYDSLLMKDIYDEFNSKEQAEAVRRYRDHTRKWWHRKPYIEERENGQG